MRRNLALIARPRAQGPVVRPGAAAHLLILVLLTAVVLFTPLNGRRERTHPAPPGAALARKPEPRAADPRAFAREAAMTPAELMSRWDPLISSAARELNVPANWIRAVMRMESGGRTMLAESEPITSSAGAMGLMQVMPETYRQMRAQLDLGADPYDPRDNIYAGAAYLKALHRQYGYPAMFAAYNDGPGNLEDHLHRGRALPLETRSYVRAIASALGGKRGAALLTRPDGTRVSIRASAVTSVRAPLPGEYADGVNAVVAMGKKKQGVRESVAEVQRLTGAV
jgi:hypothetical protein